MKEKIIIDTDWGGDAMQILAVLLSQPDKFEILGATCVFGNTSHNHVLQNCGDILHFMKADQIPYFPGAKKPSDRDIGEGDNAHGSDGIAGVKLERTEVPPQVQKAHEFILDTIKKSPKQITLIAVGPLTNISLAIQQEPDVMKKVKQILIMGGCTEEMPAKDMPFRKGNIEPDAEFNFNQAPHDADIVLNSGLPIILFPMNCTHQMTVTPLRQGIIKESFSSNPDLSDKVLGLMMAPHEIDMQKFGIAAVMHDVHTALYLSAPAHYEGKKGFISVGQNGRTDLEENENGNILSMHTVKHPDILFSLVLNGLKDCLL